MKKFNAFPKVFIYLLLYLTFRFRRGHREQTGQGVQLLYLSCTFVLAEAHVLKGDSDSDGNKHAFFKEKKLDILLKVIWISHMYIKCVGGWSALILLTEI